MDTVNREEKLVYMITNNIQAGEDFARQIKHFGYNIQLVTNMKGLENILANYRPNTILVDIHTADLEPGEDSLFDEIRPLVQLSIPLIFLSDTSEQSLRLKAVRAGGVAFYVRPLDMVGLVSRLDEMYQLLTEDPYRVLIVEDQETVANYYRTVIKMAGMATEVATNSNGLIGRLEDFSPDLILMDLYMPGVDGIELAKMIRQMDKFVSTPIVFLSTEDEFSKQMEAMRVGGDDFLTKPIKSTHLIALVRSRLERLRSLRSFMIRDSLTGLLNHTAFYSEMVQEINRCKRQNSRFSLAMLDLDRFKTVNDTYGHSVGDMVLKSLSLMLKQRLRKSDVIGRYGGEEFTVALLDTNAETAVQVMNEIREHFSEVQHISSEREVFTVTFSCGVACFPEYTEFSQLKDAADKALYRAKALGRNQVVFATELETDPTKRAA